MHSLRAAQILRHILLFTRQDLVDRHRSNMFGILWLYLQPLLYVALLSSIFSLFMQGRLGQDQDPMAYAIYLMSGVLIWNTCANILTRTTVVYSQKTELIRKLPISLWWLPLYVLISETVVYLVSLCFLGVILLVFHHMPTQGFGWLMLAILELLLFAYAVGLILATLQVFMPDVQAILGILLQFGFWMTPIVYVMNILPPSIQHVVAFNPFYWGLQAIHAVISQTGSVRWEPLGCLMILIVVLIALGRYLFVRLEKGLRDAL